MKDEHDSEVFYQSGGPVSRGGWTRVNVRRWLVIGLLLALFSLGAALYLDKTSQVAGYSNDIRLLEEQKQRLRLEIAGLDADIAHASSLDRVYAYAETHGYQNTSASDASVLVLTVDVAPVEHTPDGIAESVASTGIDPTRPRFLDGLFESLGWSTSSGSGPVGG